MTDNKKPIAPMEEERRAELESEIEEFERQTERNEAERWARKERKGCNGQVCAVACIQHHCASDHFSQAAIIAMMDTARLIPARISAF